MAPTGPIPLACNPEVFKNGEGIAKIFGTATRIDQFVKSLADKAKSRVDWFYEGGVALILHLGDEESQDRVVTAIKELEPTFQGRILTILNSEE